jgi:hypothetical protein
MMLTRRMAEKQRYTVSLPDHVSVEMEKHAKAVGATPTEYAADIVRWWFGQGCPPVTPDEIELRKRTEEISGRIRKPPKNIDVWRLDPGSAYNLVDNAVVTPLMKQLGVLNLFSHAQEHDEVHALFAFDNHPSHWIVLHLWKGHNDPEKDGLLFEALPKSTTSREMMTEKMISECLKMGAKTPFTFSQLPSVPKHSGVLRKVDPNT